MSGTNNKKIDKKVQKILRALDTYKVSNPNARIDVKRQNSVSIRIRIIDSHFEGIDRADRESPIWEILQPLSDDVFSDITMLLLLTPKEAKTSLANLEFDDPLPSRI